MTTFERLQQTIAVTLKVPPAEVTESTKDEDLRQWDSLGHINLLMALEQEFGVFFEVEEFGNLNSVRAILDHLRQQGVV
jgi:acyl carrier protein